MTSSVIPEKISQEQIIGLENVRWNMQLFFMATGLFLVGLLVWAYWGMLDVISIAQGVVAPAKKIHAVQHLEGGIIKDILVKEGDMVEKGQPLVILESTSSGADVGELAFRIASLKVDRVRLETEAASKPTLSFPETLRQAHPTQVDQAEKLFTSRQDSLKTAIIKQQKDVDQKKQEIREIRARLSFAHSRLKIVREQRNILRELMKSQLSNRFQELDLLKEANALQSQIQEDNARLARAKAGLEQAKNSVHQVKQAFREEARGKLEETQRKLAEFSERMKKYQDSLRRTTLHAPVTGTVKILYISNAQGVARPGVTLLELVPTGEKMVVEAQLLPQDIGFIRQGQRVIIQLASSDANRLGSIEGVVEHISPDTLVTQEGASYYKVRVETKQTAFEKEGVRYPLIPGVMVTAGIITGRRSVLDYMLSPFMDNSRFSFTER
ncbi:HlyD family type I secretion periplasmic adaptor subunit [Magnetococcales bacterium HHB-1]